MKHASMPRLALQGFALCLSLLTLHRPALAAEEGAPARTILLVPATQPLAYTLLNESGVSFLFPLVATATHLDSREKAKVLNERLAVDPLPLAASITNKVIERLKLLGVSVKVLEQVPRPPDAPDDIDYDKIATASDAEMLLHVYINEVGLHSTKFSKSYLPRLNVRGLLYRKAKKDYPYDGEVLYGVDAREGKDWAVLSDPKFAYASFEAILADLPGVRQAFELGVEPVANRLAEQIHAALK